MDTRNANEASVGRVQPLNKSLGGSEGYGISLLVAVGRDSPTTIAVVRTCIKFTLVADDRIKWPFPVVCPKCFKECAKPATLTERLDKRVDVVCQCDKCGFRWTVTMDGPVIKRKPDRRS